MVHQSFEQKVFEISAPPHVDAGSLKRTVEKKIRIK